MRILDVGSGPNSALASLYPDAEVVRLDADDALSPDVVMDLTSDEFQAWGPEPFDLIWMSHVMEHLSYRDALAVARKLGALLSAGGQLHVKVPSLEWAAEQILWETNNPAVPFHIFGGQFNPWQFHKSGYTMTSLRQLVAAGAGLRVGAATREMFQIGVGGDTYDAEQLYVVGVRPAEE